MSDQLAAAAQAMGVPEALVERAARARASDTGATYEEIIAAWAGGEAVAASATPEPATEQSTPEDTSMPDEQALAETPAAAPAQVPVPAAAATAPPAPERVNREEALGHPVVVTVPTAGITERTAASIPSWLGALLLIVPAFGLIYLALGATNDCGSATELRVDRVTGLVENCDGSPFEGRGGPGGAGDFIAVGQTVYAQCQGCHGPQGAGSATFPALTGILTTFGSCADHVEWVALGSAGTRAAGASSYGDTGKPIAGGMPAFGGSLSEEQLAAVVAFERVRFGGGNPDEVLADCGLVEAEGEDGATDTTVADGETPTETTGAPEADASN